MRGKARNGELDLTVGNVDLIGDCLLVVLVLVPANDDLQLFELVPAVVELNGLLAPQGVQLVVDCREVAVGNSVELAVLFDAEVFAGLLDLVQNLLGLCRQNLLIQLLFFLYLDLLPGLLRDQPLIQFLLLLLVLKLTDDFLFLSFELFVPIVDLNGFVDVLADIDDLDL